MTATTKDPALDAMVDLEREGLAPVQQDMFNAEAQADATSGLQPSEGKPNIFAEGLATSKRTSTPSWGDVLITWKERSRCCGTCSGASASDSKSSIEAKSDDALSTGSSQKLTRSCGRGPSSASMRWMIRST